MTTISVYLNFAGNTEKAFNFYKAIFREEFNSLIRFKDTKQGGKVPKQEENRILNISLPIGKDSVLMASDTLESRKQKVIQGNNMYISISPENKAEADRLFERLSTGGTIKTPMSDQPWHAYYGSLVDKYGVGWMINYTYPHVEKKSGPITKRKVKTRPTQKSKAKAGPKPKSKAKTKTLLKKKAKTLPAAKRKTKIRPAIKSRARQTTALKSKVKEIPIPRNRTKAQPPHIKVKREPAGTRGGANR